MSWPLVKLGDVAPAKPSKHAFSTSDEVWTLNLDQVEADTGKVLGKVMAPVSEAGTSTHGFDERHVLYSKLRPYLNKVALPDERGLATTELVPLLPDPLRLDRKYLAYYLRSKNFVDWVSSQVAGAKMPRVSMHLFWQHEIPLPPLPEQKRIAAILDKADAIRRKRQQAIQLSDDFLRAVFLDMFGDWEAHGWEATTVGNMAAEGKGSMRTGPFGSDLKHNEFISEGVAVLGIDNAVQNKFSWGKERFISQEKYEILKRYTVNAGDVLITIMGTCGRCAVVPNDVPLAINTKHLCCVTLNRKKCLPRFLHSYFLMHPSSGRYLRKVAKGAIMDGLNLGMIRDMPIPLVPIELQREYEFVSMRVEATREKQALGMSGLEDEFSSLSQKAFSGQL